MKILRDGDRVYVAGTRWPRQCVGTILGFAARYGENPFVEYEKAKAKGHKLVWLNGEAAVISNPPQLDVQRIQLEVGEQVNVEGNIYVVKKPGLNDGDNGRLDLLAEADPPGRTYAHLQDEARVIQNDAGWSDHSLFTVICDFIDMHRMGPACVRYLEKRSEEEQDMSEEEELDEADA